ncbi:hypothetical protein [Alloalcanivorax marinus]|uniref:hypothetical protein n=1 Tax=Alloalcanivorax marinus TaxID=1177169 RepID=UPI00195E41F7|nr:hypothetical protein [Alloalcanivorax marinus]MBM7332611.1 hypothetical protein [Alloalcanivorax marinus]
MMMPELICALVLVAVALRLGARLPRPARAVLAALALVAALLPFPYGLSGWVLSYLSHFSLSSGLLALVAIQHRLTGHYWLPVRELRAACLLLVGLALWFYPMSLGSSYADPYALGFGDTLFSAVLLLVGVFAWLNRAYASCVVLVVAQLAYGANVLHSDNLWDYLIDPWLVFWAIGWLVRDRLLVRRAQRLPAAQPSLDAPAPAAARVAGQR